jgi:PAS domain S-box-containing protein
MDNTERKRVEETLAASEKKFRDLVETTSDWVWEVDEKGVYTYASPKVRDLLGYAPEEVVGKSPFELMSPAEGARAGAILGALLAERKPLIAVENVNLHKDGRKVVLETSGVPIFDSQGAFKGYRGIDRDITARKQGQLELKRANRALRTVSACNAVLVRAESESELLDSICRLVVEEGGYCMAWVGCAEHDPGKTVRVLACYGRDEGFLASRKLTWADTEQGRGPTGTAIRSGEIQLNTSFPTNPNVAAWRDAALARGYQSGIAIPLKGSSGTIGSLTIYAREPDAFNDDEVHLLEELAEDLAFGITTLRTRAERDRMTLERQQYERIWRKSLEDSIQAIANTVEMRDPYTAGHQSRVGRLAAAIAGELGLPEEEIHGIQLAANIHDLGKIRVPAEILSKPGKLADVEFALIKTHAQAGYDILKGIEFHWPIADMVLQHHERLDGSGYPQGLKGEQIVPGARIMAVADVVEALASHRPYRTAQGIDAALAEIARGRGTLYDPAAVDACLNLFREGKFAFQI